MPKVIYDFANGKESKLVDISELITKDEPKGFFIDIPEWFADLFFYKGEEDA